MRLFFDESVGHRIPSALQHVGAPCEEITYPTRSGTFRMGMSDLEWMELAGRSGHLAITHDLHILDVPEERAALER